MLFFFLHWRVVDSCRLIAFNGTDVCDRDVAAGTSESTQISTVYLNL
jgi:hypothetical protein